MITKHRRDDIRRKLEALTYVGNHDPLVTIAGHDGRSFADYLYKDEVLSLLDLADELDRWNG